MSKDRLTRAERINILQAEIDILSGRIRQIVDSLWTMRQISLTIWIATVSLGLGVTSSTGQTIFFLIVISLFIPMLFFYMDANYNCWFRRFTMREEQIQKFLNTPIGENREVEASVESRDVQTSNIQFPVYDLTGKFTFGNDPDYRWEGSTLRSFLDSTPIIFYGFQFVGSALILMFTFPCHTLSFPLALTAFALALIALSTALLKKRTVIRVRQGEK